MTPEEREELLASYALGTLSGPDAEEVEDLVRTDGEAAAHLASYHEFVDLIALSVPLKRADPSLRDRILSAARRERRRRSRFAALAGLARWAPAAAAVLVFVFVAGWAATLQSTVSDLRDDSATLTALVQAQARQIEQLTAGEERIDQTEAVTLELQDAQRTMIGILTDPDIMTIELYSTNSGHGASGLYNWSQLEGAGMVTLQNLPTLPLGGSYVVWVEDEQARRMLSQEFTADADGSASELLRGTADAEPLRIYVAALDAFGDQGPIVLEGVVGRYR